MPHPRTTQFCVLFFSFPRGPGGRSAEGARNQGPVNQSRPQTHPSQVSEEPLRDPTSGPSHNPSLGDLLPALVPHVGVPTLELAGRNLTQRRVPATRVAPALDEIEDPQPRLDLRAEAASIQELALERREEAFAHRVVAVTDRAHRGTDVRLATPSAAAAQSPCRAPSAPGSSAGGSPSPSR